MGVGTAVRVLSVRGRWIAAFGLLAAGSAYAGVLAVTPPKGSGPNTAALKAVSERLRSAPGPEAPVIGSPDLTGGAVRVAAVSGSTTERGTLPVSVSPTPPAEGSSGAPLSTPGGAAADDGVKDIALMGVTHSDGSDQAWLVNLENQEREVVDEGGAAWGFTVKDIDDDTIILARGSDQFTLRIGEKEIPVNEAPAASPAMSEFGRGGRGGGVGGGDDRRERIRQWLASRSGGRSSSNWAGGRSWSGGGGSGGWSGSSSSGSNDWRSRGDRGRSSSRGFSGGGGFNPGMAWAMSGGGFNRRGSQTQNTGPTSNPQTARRRGGQLIGGADPIETPDAISNPQTTRRLGTNSGGTAFGDASYQNGGRSNSGRSNTGRR